MSQKKCHYGGNNGNGPNALCGNKNCGLCLGRSFASHPRHKNWSDKNILTPRQISRCSHKKYWFDCECGHEFEQTPHAITRNGKGRWCPYCCKPCQKLCENKDCEMCFNNSLASVIHPDYWSERNELSSRQIIKGSERIVWIICDKCPHEFNPRANVISRGNWCPFCCSPVKRLCDDLNCEWCRNNSFESYPKSQYWSKKNNTIPRQVIKGTNDKYWFDCPNCPHDFDASPHNIIKGEWCPYCSYRKLCENPDCDFCRGHSFESYPLSRFWSKKNKLKPRQVAKTSLKKYWFDCENEHEFHMALNNVCAGEWCPHCRYKSENKLYEFLFKTFPDVSYHHKFSWCKSIRESEFDFYIPSLNLIIELDGEQHFEQISNWKPPDITRGTDILKMSRALEHGISIIRLYRLDIFLPSFDQQAFDRFANFFLQRRETPTIFFVSSDDTVYDDYIREIEEDDSFAENIDDDMILLLKASIN